MIIKKLIELLKNFVREERVMEDKKFKLEKKVMTNTAKTNYRIEKRADISTHLFMKSCSIENAMRLLRNLYEAGYTHIKDESYITDYGGKYDYDDVGSSGELEIVSKFVAISYKKST